MYKKIILLLLILSMGTVFADDFGNTINEKEYPAADAVLPQKTDKADFIIEGSVEKNIDMTLDKCIELALGNNPQINSAFHDILASDARIKLMNSDRFMGALADKAYKVKGEKVTEWVIKK